MPDRRKKTLVIKLNEIGEGASKRVVDTEVGLEGVLVYTRMQQGKRTPAECNALAHCQRFHRSLISRRSKLYRLYFCRATAGRTVEHTPPANASFSLLFPYSSLFHCHFRGPRRNVPLTALAPLLSPRLAAGRNDLTAIKNPPLRFEISFRQIPIGSEFRENRSLLDADSFPLIMRRANPFCCSLANAPSALRERTPSATLRFGGPLYLPYGNLLAQSIPVPRESPLRTLVNYPISR